MNRDEETKAAPRRSSAGDEVESEQPASRESDEVAHRASLSLRSRAGTGAWQPPSAPLPPFKVQPSIMNRNVPSHPAWEKPLIPYNYPRIRGQEKRQTMKPLLFAAIGVALVIGAVVAFPALMHKGSAAPTASGSALPSSSISNQPTQSVTPAQPSNSAQGSPAPVASFQQYKVQAGDSVAKIAAKFHLQRWELLLANPQITAPAYAVRINTYLNIPLPGQLTQPPVTPTASLAATLVAP